jgi:phosphotransferase system enzyme I (PtsI)
MARWCSIMAERRYAGRGASPGIASGCLVHLRAAASARVATGDAGREAAALRKAMAAAAAELAALAADAGEPAAGILGFQLALLEDDALSEPAFAAIAAGAAADVGWRQALDAEIALYGEAEDENFRARAGDLADLRDRVLARFAGVEPAAALPPGSIVVAADLPPSRFLSIDWRQGGGILLLGGSPTSHVAMLARSRGVPLVVGIAADPAELSGEALVDGTAGEAIVDPSPDSIAEFERRRRSAAIEEARAGALVDRPAMTADRVRIAVHLNVAGPAELAAIRPIVCDGIGLVRSEFLFHGKAGLPGEETQFAFYRRIVEWAEGRPVTIRTLDAGGDKPIAGLTIDGESNPFLGVRGIRLSLARPEIFRVQLRALARAAAHGDLKVMLPMVTVPAELAAARTLLDEEVAALAAAGIPARRPPLGIMVEVPATALTIEEFDADFFSIGSNDLTQYVTAAGRDIAAVADLADPLNPGVIRLIEMVVAHGIEHGREVSLCGDAGGDPAVIPRLLGTGLRTLSVAPPALGCTKAAIAAMRLGVSPARAFA